MPYTSPQTVARRAARFMHAPMAEWRNRAERLTPEERDAISDRAALLAERATRASMYLAYLTQTTGKIDDPTHRAAVRKQNRAAARTRRANGYTMPSTVTF